MSQGSLIVLLDGAQAAAQPAQANGAATSAAQPAARRCRACAAAAAAAHGRREGAGHRRLQGRAVIEIAVKIGDTVEKEQSLVTLESDKATMDVPSPAAASSRTSR
ncbi:hypothetical protein BMMON3_20590 [Burkholderia mallei]